jgi:hypothetical protein
MMTALKAVLEVGTLAVFVAACGGEANAVPLVSSWYGPGFEGTTTASGEIYRADARTAAHPSLCRSARSYSSPREKGRRSWGLQIGVLTLATGHGSLPGGKGSRVERRRR